jgi:hypothetical protein
MENHGRSWISWALAILLGTAAVAPQVKFNAAKQGAGETHAAGGNPGRETGLSQSGPDASGVYERTCLRPLAEFLQANPDSRPYLEFETRLKRQGRKGEGWEIKAPPMADLEDVRSSAAMAAGGPDTNRGAIERLLHPNAFLQILLACIPDPTYSDLAGVHDLFFQSIKGECHAMGWFYAGHWYPEMNGTGQALDAYRTLPRSLLLSRPIRTPGEWNPEQKNLGTEQNQELLLVLFIPESPTRGVDLGRLRTALEIAEIWQHSSTPSAFERAAQLASLHARKEVQTFKAWWSQNGLDGSDSINKLLFRLASMPSTETRLPGWEDDLQSVWKLFRDGIRGKGLKASGSDDQGAQSPGTMDLTKHTLRFLEKLEGLAHQSLSFGRALKILGPDFSGSAQGIGETLSTFQAAGRHSLGEILLISPTTTSQEVRERSFWPPSVEPKFLPLSLTSQTCRKAWCNLDASFPKLRSGKKWAWIHEVDTTYGSGQDPSEDWMNYPLPAHLSSLRLARGSSIQEPLAGISGPLRQALDQARPLDLTQAGVDATPEPRPLDPHPAPAQDLELRILAEDMEARGITGAYIQMTSIQDMLFIAKELRIHNPALVLVSTSYQVEMFHPDMAKALEGLFLVSMTPPYPGLWRLSNPTSRFDPSFEDLSAGIPAYGEEYAGLIRLGTWLLENSFKPPHEDWSLLDPPPQTQEGCWLDWDASAPEHLPGGLSLLGFSPGTAMDGRLQKGPDSLFLDRPAYVSQLRHGRFWPVFSCSESLPTRYPDWGGQVCFKQYRLTDPSSAPTGSTGIEVSGTGWPVLCVDPTIIMVGRLQRLLLSIVALAALFLGFPGNAGAKVRDPNLLAKMRRILGCGAWGQENHSAYLKFCRMALPALLLFCLALYSHTMWWVFCQWRCWGAGRFPPGSADVVETLLLVVTVLIMATASFLVCSNDLSWPHSSKGRRTVARLAGLLPLAGFLWLFFPVGEKPLADSARTLAGLEPFTGLAYLAPFFIIALFLALSIRLEGWRNFHGLRNRTIMPPECFTGQSPYQPNPPLLPLWFLAAASILVFYLIEQTGALQSNRWTPPGNPGIVLRSSLALVLAILGLVLTSRLTAVVRGWRNLRRRSFSLELAPWRSAYKEVGKAYPWRPTRGMAPFAGDNRSKSFQLMWEYLVAQLPSGDADLRSYRALLNELKASGSREQELRTIAKLDELLAGILKDLRPHSSPTVQRILALHTYLYYRRNLTEIRYNLYLGAAAAFTLQFTASSGLLGGTYLVYLAYMGLGSQMAITAWLVLDLEANGLLSSVADTLPGKANWNQDTWLALLKPSFLTAVALLATELPGFGILIAKLLST